MTILCEALGLPRSSAYYRAQPGEDRLIRAALIELAGQWPTYGYRRLTVMLQRQGHVVNGKRVRRLMRELGTDREFSASFDHQASATLSFSFPCLFLPDARKTVFNLCLVPPQG